MPLDASTETALKTGARAAAETVLVGGSNLINGDIKRGSAYALLGLVARAAFGVPGALVVAAASFVDATTGKTLPEHLGINSLRPKSEPATPAPAAKNG